MLYKIEFSNGDKADGFESVQDAIEYVESIYPDAECGHDGDLLNGGDRTLCWADSASAENDDGARAIASIRRDFD
jgi:hypothetical protein